MADYLSVAEAAAELGLSPTAVRTLIKKDELAGAFQNPSRAWVVPEEAVKTYRAEQKKAGKPARRPAPVQSSSAGTRSAGEKKKPTPSTAKRAAIEKTEKPAKRARASAKRTSEKEDIPASGNIFQSLYEMIDGLSDRSPDDRKKIADSVRKVEEETNHGGGIDPEKVKMLLTSAGELAPDIIEVTLAVVANPALGAALLIRKVAMRAREGNA
jgi:hypothetical protein